MTQWVEIQFDCLPLRSLPRVDSPLDASPKLAAKLERIRTAIEAHGTFNTYYLHSAACKFHFTNDPALGSVGFTFEGTVFTDQYDKKSIRCDLVINLDRETCDWLNEYIVTWLKESVHHAVKVEFDRYIAAGSLEQTRQRLAQIEQTMEANEGFVGMYL